MLNGGEYRGLDHNDDEHYVTHRQLTPFLLESAVSSEKIKYIENHVNSIESTLKDMKETTLKDMNQNLSMLVQKDNLRAWIAKAVFIVGGSAFGIIASNFTEILKYFVR